MKIHYIDYNSWSPLSVIETDDGTLFFPIISASAALTTYKDTLKSRYKRSLVRLHEFNLHEKSLQDLGHDKEKTILLTLSDFICELSVSNAPLAHTINHALMSEFPEQLKKHFHETDTSDESMVEVTSESIQNTVITSYEGHVLHLIYDPSFGFTMTTKEVAEGFEVDEATIRQHKQNYADELIQGKHFISVHNSNTNPQAGIPHIQTVWTKMGIVRLGFIIKTDRATHFSEWINDLDIENLFHSEEKGFRNNENLSDTELFSACFNRSNAIRNFCNIIDSIANRNATLGFPSGAISTIANDVATVALELKDLAEQHKKSIGHLGQLH